MSEPVVVYGGALKALGDGRWGGYLVRYGTPDQSDVVGDYFTKSTDFDWPDEIDVVSGTSYYNHGLDPVLKNRKLGSAILKKDEFGVWAEGQMQLRDRYERYIYSEIEAGRMGLSSGTLPNLMAKKSVGNGKHEITAWPIGKDVSITPTPAEPRNSVLAIKSFIESLPVQNLEAIEATYSEAAAVEHTSTQGTKTMPVPQVETVELNTATMLTMSEEQLNALINGSVQNSVKVAMNEFMNTAPAIKSAGQSLPATGNESLDQAQATYLKSFNQYLHDGDRSAIKAAAEGIKAAMQIGTNSEGGFLVPVTLANYLITKIRDGSIMRRAGARVITLSKTKSFSIPVQTDSGAAVLTAEEGTYDEQEPTISVVEFNPYKFTRLAKASEELVEDSEFDIFNEVLAPDAANAFIQAENIEFTTGSGSSRPQGALTGATLGKTAASATAITFDEIIDLHGSVDEFYRNDPSCGWMMNDLTATLIRKIKDSTGQYLWQPALVAGNPPTILGKPVWINRNMPTVATTNKTILFGAFNRFVIADYTLVIMQRLNELFAATGQIGFRWAKRFDSNVVDSAALKYLQQA